MLEVQLHQALDTLDVLKKFGLEDSVIQKAEKEVADLKNKLSQAKERNKGLNRYVVSDINTGLFAEDAVFYGKNSADAIRHYMQSNGIKGSIKRSASRSVRFKAVKTYVQNGTVYRTGNDIWYEFQKEGV